jgi:hypothetical protein
MMEFYPQYFNKKTLIGDFFHFFLESFPYTD